MANSIDIDWGQVRPVPDMVGSAVNAFKVGQDLGKSTALMNANQTYAQDPQAGIKAATAIDPIYGGQLQTQQNQQQDRASTIAQAAAEGQGDIPGAIAAAAKRGATGDVSTLRAQLDAIPGQQKAQVIADAQQKNEQLAHILMGLQSYPVEQRLGIAQHVAQQTGIISPQSITDDDVSDLGIQRHLASAMSVEQFLKQQADRNKPLVVPAGGKVVSEASLAGETPAAGVSPGAQPQGPVNASPGDLDSLARAIYTEADGEGPQGQAAVGHVILNRAQTGYGGAKTIADVVNAPGQFEGMTSGRQNVATNDPGYQRALQVAQGVVSGQIPDPTNGADHFLNPQLQSQLGRPQPPWASGAGQRIGNHVFYGSQGPGAAAAPKPAAGQQAGVLFDNPKVEDASQDVALNPATVDYLAHQNLLTGQLPPLGMGRQGAANRALILNRAAEIEAQTGASGADAVTRHMAVKAAGQGLNTVTRQRALIEPAENTTIKNADLALSLAAKGGGQTGIPVLNRWLQAGRQNIAGDPDVASFNNAIGTTADEYAKVMSGGTGSQGATDSTRAEAYRRLSASSSPAQLKSVIATMKTEMENRRVSLVNQEQALRDQIGRGGAPPPPTAPAGKEWTFNPRTGKLE